MVHKNEAERLKSAEIVFKKYSKKPHLIKIDRWFAWKPVVTFAMEWVWLKRVIRIKDHRPSLKGESTKGWTYFY